LNRDKRIKIIEIREMIWGINTLSDEEVIIDEIRVTKIKIKILNIWVIIIV